MRKIFLYFLAAFMLSSCDNLKKKDAKTDADDEEVTSTKKKKPLSDDESADEEESPKKKKNTIEDEEEPAYKKHSTDDEEADQPKNTTSEYSAGWSTADKNTFMSTCVNGAKGSMGQTGAKNYCSCMLEKIESIYPNANDAGAMTNEKTTQLARECLQQ